MATSQKENQKLVKRLQNKFRLVVINDDTFEERFSVILSPLNVFTWGGLIFMIFVFSIYGLIAYTPLREFIPGYADVTTRKMATYAAFKADSLERALNQNLQYVSSIKAIIQGRDPNTQMTNTDTAAQINPASIKYEVSKEDSALRKKVENEEKYSLAAKELGRELSGMTGVFFFKPIEGKVTGSFDPKASHYGVDIAAKENEAVLAVIEGTVVLATWTPETGHVIQVQHKNNVLSVYKHNSVLLKSVGEKVKAGEALAIVGNSGKHTTGPHLHFELWYDGSPINPQDYILF